MVQAICHGRQIPAAGDYYLYDAQPRPLIIIRGDDARIRAFLNLCRHREMRLLSGAEDRSSGHCPNGLIRCPYHAWVYDSRGCLRQTPFERDFPDFDKSLWHLHEIGIEVREDWVYIASFEENTT
jgi:phenylpropionate dioxygenase-like ring-hydroxylating dioxygenase large terminal subunit